MGVRTRFPGRTPATSGFLTADLSPIVNNVGVSAASDTGCGHFNVWRNSFPAEHMPQGGRVVSHGVPFDLQDFGGGQPDNVRCDGQYITVPEGRYDWIYLLAAAERRAQDDMPLHFCDGYVDLEPLRVSDFWHAPPVFGEQAACTSPVMHYPHHVQPNLSAMLWQQRVPVTRRAPVIGLQMPRNIAIHIFAVTLQTAPEQIRQSERTETRS